MSDTETSQKRIDPGAATLFNKLEASFPSSILGTDRWYLLAISALTGIGKPECARDLYLHLTSQPQYAASDARKALVRRLREALVKCVSIIGVCKPLVAVFAICDVEREEDKDYSFSREHWQSGPESRQRGQEWLDAIYKENRTATLDRFAAHKDFSWISTNITYGLYLSDHTILGPIDTQILVLSGIMVQNLRPMTAWHLRGTRRVGVSSEDVERLQQCIEMVADFAGVKLDDVPRVGDIEHEV